MQGKIILISDDSDFFEFIIPKLKLRNSDELFRFSFNDLPDKIHMLNSALLFINSENNQSQTLELLDIVKDIPTVVFGYNNDEQFKIEAYKKGMYEYITLSTSEEELEAKMLPALRLIATAQKNNLYRNLLVNNNIITKNNEVFLDFVNILDQELENIKNNASAAVLAAISADEQSKYTIQSNLLETIILNNIRKNDILMNYSYNKYFLLLNNTNVDKAKKLWDKISVQLPKGIYAGIVEIGTKNRQQVVNEALNSLHRIMTGSVGSTDISKIYSGNNFKFFRQEFNKKIEQVISPIFYQIQQIYNNKLYGMKIEQGVGEGYGVLYIISEKNKGSFKITSPGFASINIDITYENLCDNPKSIELEPKRITIEPEELEAGILLDLLEEFIQEFKTANEIIAERDLL